MRTSFAIVLLAALFNVSLAGYDDGCSKPCTLIYVPHCGSDGVTYSNACHLEVAQCRDPTLRLFGVPGVPCTAVGRRDQVPDFNCIKLCPFVYIPYCGSDGVTYSNLCTFEVAKCSNPQLQLAGPSGVPCSAAGRGIQAPSVDCEKPCTLEYIPHCGSDGVTYGNFCAFEIAQCRNPHLKLAAVPGVSCQASTRRLQDRDLRCLKPCTTEYIPHCGSDGVTYANRCSFEVAQCSDPELKLAADVGKPCNVPAVGTHQRKDKVRKCEEKPCPMDYFPHCGSDKITYANACAFEIAQCKDSSLQLTAPPGTACGAAAKLCDKRCPRSFDPHCGSDGVTYANSCEFEVAQCNDPTLSLSGNPGTQCERDSRCAKPCSREIEYHCGSDGVTYINSCLFEIAQCEDSTLVLDGPVGVRCTNPNRRALREKRRPECDRECPTNLDPYCGSDGILYGNACEFELAMCLDASLNELTLLPGEDCASKAQAIMRDCSKDCRGAIPFAHCGTDGVTYQDLCHFEAAQCLNPLLQIAFKPGTSCEDGPEAGNDVDATGNRFHVASELGRLSRSERKGRGEGRRRDKSDSAVADVDDLGLRGDKYLHDEKLPFCPEGMGEEATYIQAQAHNVRGSDSRREPKQTSWTTGRWPPCRPRET